MAAGLAADRTGEAPARDVRHQAGRERAHPHWTRVADNIAAIAAHVAALRGIERWGVGTLEQAFRGYQAIENLRGGVPWRRALGFHAGEAITLTAVEMKFRTRAREVHPDHGGSHEAMAET